MAPVGTALPVRKGWGMAGELLLQLSEDGADAERLDELTGYLRRDLLQLDLEDVSAWQAGAPPPGARGVELAALGGLSLTLGGSAEILKAVVGAISHWLRRSGTSHRTVRLEIGGDQLELSEVSDAEQERLISLFVSRHSTG